MINSVSEPEVISVARAQQRAASGCASPFPEFSGYVMFQPAWVTEQCLRVEPFDCCGDADLLPFRCAACGRLLVLCYECETFYCDLGDLTQRRFANWDDDSCPQCGAEFGDVFGDEQHRASFAQWHAAGLDHLIEVPGRDAFTEMLNRSAAQLAEWLARGMRSTAKTRMTDYRNLAESLIDCFPGAIAIRRQGRETARRGTLQAACRWSDTFRDPVERAFAILGVTDHLVGVADADDGPPA